MNDLDSRPIALADGSVVHSDPEIHSGTSVFVGTRVPVQTFVAAQLLRVPPIE